MSYFKPDRETIIETAVSDFSLACILPQIKEAIKKLPLFAFHYRKFNSVKMKYDIQEKKMITIVTVFKNGKHLFKSTRQEVMVYIDYKNLLSLREHRRGIEWTELEEGSVGNRVRR